MMRPDLIERARRGDRDFVSVAVRVCQAVKRSLSRRLELGPGSHRHRA
jgi:hypothetical protein